MYIMKLACVPTSTMRWRNALRSFRGAGRLRRRRTTLSVEFMEARRCLSALTSVPAGSGIDSIAMGDVNGDQIADVAVASHRNGQYEVDIYNGAGQVDASTATGYSSQLLATIPDPFNVAAGPLDVALGDFAGDGISQLAISAQNSNQISFWTFQLPTSAATDGPLNSPVIPVSMGAFTPAGLENAQGINLAAVSIGNTGVYQLVATAAANGPGKFFVLSYGGQNSWQVTQTISNVPVKSTKGLSVSAGNVTNDGLADIVVGSQVDGKVAVYSEDLNRWVLTTSPLGKKVKGVRVAVDSSEGGTGLDRGD